MRLVVAGGHALLVVGGRLIVGVNDGVRGDTVGVVRLGPGVDGVDVRDILEHGGTEEGEHFCHTCFSAKNPISYQRIQYHTITISIIQLQFLSRHCGIINPPF
jgi:hypothetical protein